MLARTQVTSAPNKLRKRPSRPLGPSHRFSVNSYSNSSTLCESQDQWVLIPSLPYPSDSRPGDALREFGRKCKRSLSFSRSRNKEPKQTNFGYGPRTREIPMVCDKPEQIRPRVHSSVVRSSLWHTERAMTKRDDIRPKYTPNPWEYPEERDNTDELLIEVLAQFPSPPQMCRQPTKPGVRGHNPAASFSLPTYKAYPGACRQSQGQYPMPLSESRNNQYRQKGLLLHRRPNQSEVPFPSPFAY